MNELMNARSNKRDFRWKLLTTVSAMALLVAVCGASESKAADQEADRPTVWIEIGGQMEHINGQGDSFAPAFLAANPNSSVLQPTTPLQAQRPTPFNFGEDGKISIQPKDSDWVFSAAVRYGRSSSSRAVDHQTKAVHYTFYKYGAPFGGNNGNDPQPNTVADFADTYAHREESHTVLDFSVGKDVGLGMFGKSGSSIVEFGLRFAQFASKATFDVRARPDIEFKYHNLATFGAPNLYVHLPHFHNYYATGQASRSFHGAGPSLSWSGSAPFAGNLQDGELAVDWGADAALLFGKQKARAQHHETSQYVPPTLNQHYQSGYHHPTRGHTNSRSVTVPNVGGFAGASYRMENFKVSFGYRADFFFGAIDGGIDTRKSETLGFYGPFATISVGLGG